MPPPGETILASIQHVYRRGHIFGWRPASSGLSRIAATLYAPQDAVRNARPGRESLIYPAAHDPLDARPEPVFSRIAKA
jgi:hypothetical protein